METWTKVQMRNGGIIRIGKKCDAVIDELAAHVAEGRTLVRVTAGGKDSILLNLSDVVCVSPESATKG